MEYSSQHQQQMTYLHPVAPPNTPVSVDHYSTSVLPSLSSSALSVAALGGVPSPVETQQQVCAICGDRATGKHYGSFSCDGCKGFFRRSVRKHHQYSCRFNRCCPIDKDKRNTCRFCRLEKCYRAGMKKEAVQNERDKISVRRSSYDDYTTSNELSISKLVDAEARTNNMNAHELMSAVHSSNAAADMLAEVFPQVPGQPAGVNDVCNSMQVQLLTLLEWAKTLSVFSQLQISEKIALLRAHAGEMLILGVVWRTVKYGSPDTLVLGNKLVISRESTEFQAVASRILDELVVPFKELDVQETEYSILKAVVFFDPDALEATPEKQNVRNWRHQIQLEMMDHMNDRQYTTPRGRFGSLLLLLPKLQSCAQLMIQELHAARIYNKVVIDKLLQELLLAGEKQPLLTSPVATHMTQPSHSENFCNQYQVNGDAAASVAGQIHLALPVSVSSEHNPHFVFGEQMAPAPTPFYQPLTAVPRRTSLSQPASPSSLRHHMGPLPPSDAVTPASDHHHHHTQQTKQEML